MNKFASFIIVAVFIVAFAFGAWHLKRWFNYSFGYQDQVRSTVCEMVKPEYLKNPC